MSTNTHWINLYSITRLGKTTHFAEALATDREAVESAAEDIYDYHQTIHVWMTRSGEWHCAPVDLSSEIDAEVLRCTRERAREPAPSWT